MVRTSTFCCGRLSGSVIAGLALAVTAMVFVFAAIVAIVVGVGAALESCLEARGRSGEDTV